MGVQCWERSGSRLSASSGVSVRGSTVAAGRVFCCGVIEPEPGSAPRGGSTACLIRYSPAHETCVRQRRRRDDKSVSRFFKQRGPEKEWWWYSTAWKRPLFARLAAGFAGLLCAHVEPCPCKDPPMMAAPPRSICMCVSSAATLHKAGSLSQAGREDVG